MDKLLQVGETTLLFSVLPLFSTTVNSERKEFCSSWSKFYTVSVDLIFDGLRFSRFRKGSPKLFPFVKMCIKEVKCSNVYVFFTGNENF